MTYPINDTERAVVDQIERFASEVLAPQADCLMKTHFLPRFICQHIRNGAHGMNLPEEVGALASPVRRSMPLLRPSLGPAGQRPRC